MKKLGCLLILTTLLLGSCNRNDELDLDIDLPINSVFIPVSMEINREEINEQEREEIMKLVNSKHVVNDVSELPNDPIGQNEAFQHINYKEQTLLIMYLFKRWTFETYSNRFYRNTQENTYNWVLKLGVTLDNDDNTEQMQLTRFAILVRKLPVNADVETWYSLTQLGGAPD